MIFKFLGSCGLRKIVDVSDSVQIISKSLQILIESQKNDATKRYMFTQRYSLNVDNVEDLREYLQDITTILDDMTSSHFKEFKQVVEQITSAVIKNFESSHRFHRKNRCFLNLGPAMGSYFDQIKNSLNKFMGFFTSPFTNIFSNTQNGETERFPESIEEFIEETQSTKCISTRSRKGKFHSWWILTKLIIDQIEREKIENAKYAKELDKLEDVVKQLSCTIEKELLQ